MSKDLFLNQRSYDLFINKGGNLPAGFNEDERIMHGETRQTKYVPSQARMEGWLWCIKENIASDAVIEAYCKNIHKPCDYIASLKPNK